MSINSIHNHLDDDDNDLSKTCYEFTDNDHEGKNYDILDYNKHINDDIIIFIDAMNQNNDDVLVHGNDILINNNNNNNHTRLDDHIGGDEDNRDGVGKVVSSKTGSNNDNNDIIVNIINVNDSSRY